MFERFWDFAVVVLRITLVAFFVVAVVARWVRA